MAQEQFTVLENRAIGRNISMFRKVKEIKAADVAEAIGITETAYTKYERGETQITIDFIQKVADVLKVDPLTLLSSSPSNFIENIHNSPVVIHGESHYQTTNEEQTQLITKLVENVIAMNANIMDMNKKIMTLLDKK